LTGICIAETAFDAFQFGSPDESAGLPVFIHINIAISIIRGAQNINPKIAPIRSIARLKSAEYVPLFAGMSKQM